MREECMGRHTGMHQALAATHTVHARDLPYQNRTQRGEKYLRGRQSRDDKGAGKAGIPGNDPVPTQTPLPLQTHQQ